MTDPLRRCGNPDLFRLFIGCMAWIIVMACLAAFALWILQCP